jgi:protein FRA10AC1
MQLAKRYYDKLFKEYCIADLTHFDRNKIGMRWRTEAEVVRGKGQFECGSKHCDVRKKLTTWEVNFSYVEHGEHKNALVKLRLCKACSLKLNFHSQKRKIKKEAKQEKKKKRKKHRKRRHSSSSSSSDESDREEQPSTSKATSKVKEEKADEVQVGYSFSINYSCFQEAQKETEKEASQIWSKPPEMPEEDQQPQDEIDTFLDDLFV